MPVTSMESSLLNLFQARPFECVRYWILAERGQLRDDIGEIIFKKEQLGAEL